MEAAMTTLRRARAGSYNRSVSRSRVSNSLNCVAAGRVARADHAPRAGLHPAVAPPVRPGRGRAVHDRARSGSATANPRWIWNRDLERRVFCVREQAARFILLRNGNGNGDILIHARSSRWPRHDSRAARRRAAASAWRTDVGPVGVAAFGSLTATRAQTASSTPAPRPSKCRWWCSGH